MRKHKFVGFVIFVASLVLSSLFLVNAAESVADWTRAYCLYNAGAGSYACDSGQVPNTNNAACAASEATKCAEEGDVYCFANSSCEDGGTTGQGPINPYTVDWDNSQTSCNCLFGGPGRWAIGGEADATGCCGDEATEFYSGKWCDGSAACCDAATDASWKGSCLSACPNITEVYFSDMVGSILPTAQPMNAKDFVQIVIKLEGAPDNTPLNITIWALQGAAHCYDDMVDTKYAVGNQVVVLWQIKNCSSGGTDAIQFQAYFAEPAFTWKSNQSAVVPINPIEDDSPPVALISNPHLGDLFQINTNINFVSGSYDIDDPIASLLWDFGDGTTSNEQNPVHSYVTGGPRIISLTVQDQRGLVAQDKIGIEIDDPGKDDPALAFISKPKFGQTFPAGVLVDFDASSSKDDIKPTVDNLEFTWQFSDGFKYVATGMAGAKWTRLFETSGKRTVTLTVDDKDAPSPPVETMFFIGGCRIVVGGEEEYITYGVCRPMHMDYFCALDGTVYSTMYEHCEGLDGVPLTADDCCPRGYYCPTGGPSPQGACVVQPNDCGTYINPTDCQNNGCIWIGSCAHPADFSSCSDYPNKSICEADVLGLGRIGGRGLGTEMCGGTVGNTSVTGSSCTCVWDAVNGICNLYLEARDILTGTTVLSCVRNFSSLSTCQLGKQTLTWQGICTGAGCGTPAGQAICPSSGRKEIKCATAISKLSFFSLLSIVIVIALLVAYYCFRVKRRKKVKLKPKRTAKRRKKK